MLWLIKNQLGHVLVQNLLSSKTKTRRLNPCKDRLNNEADKIKSFEEEQQRRNLERSAKKHEEVSAKLQVQQQLAGNLLDLKS